MKKLIIDSCTKTAFLLIGVVCYQTDGVSIGASLGFVMINIIMAKFKKVIVDSSMNHPIMRKFNHFDEKNLICYW